MRWNCVHYELIFYLSELAILISNMHNPTKRQIVGIAKRFYDPIGFVSPVIIIISFKKLFQELCTKKIDWDEPLSGQLLRKWTQLVSASKEYLHPSQGATFLSSLRQSINPVQSPRILRCISGCRCRCSLPPNSKLH